jgi:hypothetical protein
MNIELTDFALRHFDKTFGGTKILDCTPQRFNMFLNPVAPFENFKLLDGYAPFCKLLPIKNFTDARIGSLPITLENYQYLRSGYSARREGELPVFSRWFELPISKPKAEWLMLVLYSNEQLHKEHSEDKKNAGVPFLFGADWGVVAILGQSHPNEEPMKPETMLRNALGIEYGGSGVALDKEKYLESVEFWDKNATLK